MRRHSPHVEFITKQRDHLLSILATLDPRAVASTLEPYCADRRRERLRHVFERRLDSVTVVMDAPHDPHNGAAVIRSCDAFGVHRLHVVERLEDFLASNTVARGSERWVDVHSHATPAAAIEAMRHGGYELVATHPDGELEPPELAEIPRVALVLGNERDGITAELRAACQRSVRIPMRGFAESLNVSVTAAILLQLATHHREGDLPPDEVARCYARGLILSVPRAAAILDAHGVSLPGLPRD